MEHRRYGLNPELPVQWGWGEYGLQQPLWPQQATTALYTLQGLSAHMATERQFRRELKDYNDCK